MSSGEVDPRAIELGAALCRRSDAKSALKVGHWLSYPCPVHLDEAERFLTMKDALIVRGFEEESAS